MEPTGQRYRDIEYNPYCECSIRSRTICVNCPYIALTGSKLCWTCYVRSIIPTHQLSNGLIKSLSLNYLSVHEYELIRQQVKNILAKFEGYSREAHDKCSILSVQTCAIPGCVERSAYPYDNCFKHGIQCSTVECMNRISYGTTLCGACNRPCEIVIRYIRKNLSTDGRYFEQAFDEMLKMRNSPKRKQTNRAYDMVKKHKPCLLQCRQDELSGHVHKS
jgi:hypothetical protein